MRETHPSSQGFCEMENIIFIPRLHSTGVRSGNEMHNCSYFYTECSCSHIYLSWYPYNVGINCWHEYLPDGAQSRPGDREEDILDIFCTPHIKKSYAGWVSPEKEYSSEGEVHVLEDPVEREWNQGKERLEPTSNTSSVKNEQCGMRDFIS